MKLSNIFITLSLFCITIGTYTMEMDIEKLTDIDPAEVTIHYCYDEPGKETYTLTCQRYSIYVTHILPDIYKCEKSFGQSTLFHPCNTNHRKMFERIKRLYNYIHNNYDRDHHV